MEHLEAKILLRNLLNRIRKNDDNYFELSGSLTYDEVTALKLSLSALEDSPHNQNSLQTSQESNDKYQEGSELKASSKSKNNPTSSNNTKTLQLNKLETSFELDTSSLELPPPPEDRRLCLDFGTAMSKVTLVIDHTDSHDLEEIKVLELGIAGDQEEVSETMLISSVYIDENGYLWFGKKAQDLSKFTPEIQRLDNIKRYLSEEGLQETVVKRFNPTNIEIKYADVVLSYLMYLTWTVNQSLKNSGEPRNLNRRFAMPCFAGVKSRETNQTLARMLGEAQVLSDTFYHNLQDGIPLNDFVSALNQLRCQKLDYNFVKEAITEPLGVAGSLISWEENVNSLVMVIDVGAGTSDFSLYRMAYNPSTEMSTAIQVANSTEGITEAGNYLDNLLRGLILQRAEITHEHEHYKNYLGDLELSLRDYKEHLFTHNEVHARLFNGELIHVKLDDFINLPQVKQFSQSLIDCRNNILQRVDKSFIEGAPNSSLAIALSGGGASLPMVKALVNGQVNVNGKQLNLIQTNPFPAWLAEEYEELEHDYPRIAVSLGGARKSIIKENGIANITAGDVKSPAVLGGFFTKGV